MVLNMFGDLFTYLKFLISGDNKNLMRLRELKRIFKNFRPSKYRYITKEKRITNLFLQRMITFSDAINVFKPVLDTTLFNSDEKKAQLFLNHFVESNLPEDVVAKREKFTKDIMWNKIMESETLSKGIKTIEDEFRMYMNFLTRKNMPKLESEYYLMYKLNTLSTFNFDLFFSKFDSDYRGTGKPAFAPIIGDEILNDLKDLYFLITSLPAKTDLVSAFAKLFGRTQEDFKHLAKKAQQSVNLIYKMISDELSPGIILNMCRYISEESKLKINVDQKIFGILEKYRKQIEDRFIKNKDYVIEKYSEKSLQQDIQDLFKGKHLLKIEGYTDELIKLIEENNFSPISGIQAIRITKTFILEIYEEQIKETINQLILEAFFNEKDFQTDFSNKFFSANELKDYMLGFEESLSTTGKNSFQYLKTVLHNFRANTATGENKVIKLIETTNDRIRHANEKCADILYQLGTSLYKIIQDYKSPKPTYISNVKNIRGGQNKEFINNLASSYNSTAKYIKIIKNFVMVDPASKK